MKYQWHDVRKSQRNKVRAKFLDESGVTPIHDAGDIQGNFAEYQKRAIQMLTEKHEVMSQEDISFMRNVAESVVSLDLGVANGFGTVPYFRSASARYQDMAKNWFTGDYSHSGIIAKQIFGK